ncbi:MAG: 50S ribosomal protein L18 [Deltaproteobacteria bacterium]|nr:50S ribosomal protein L18 [Deltaproteobacteria bacterium]
MRTIRRADARLKRKKRVRKGIKGVPKRPRLCVFRTLNHIYAQIIDDSTARTLIAASSLSKEIQPQINGKESNREGASIVGKSIAARALEKGIKKVVFDRNGFLYHGRIKALAEAAREGGLEF